MWLRCSLPPRINGPRAGAPSDRGLRTRPPVRPQPGAKQVPIVEDPTERERSTVRPHERETLAVRPRKYNALAGQVGTSGGTQGDSTAATVAACARATTRTVRAARTATAVRTATASDLASSERTVRPTEADDGDRTRDLRLAKPVSGRRRSATSGDERTQPCGFAVRPQPWNGLPTRPGFRGVWPVSGPRPRR